MKNGHLIDLRVPRPLSGFTDAEVVLLDAVIGSGGRFRPHDSDDVEQARQARQLDARLRGEVIAEMRARRLTSQGVAGALVTRALEALK